MQIGGILIIRKTMIVSAMKPNDSLQAIIDWLCVRYGVLIDPNECLTWTESWDNNNVVSLLILDALANINWHLPPNNYHTDIWLYQGKVFSIYQIGHYQIDLDSIDPQTIIYKSDLIVDVVDPLVALEFKLAVF